MNDKEADKKPWADATKVILPTFQGGGTHVNLSGVVLVKNAPEQGQRDEVHRMDGRRRRRSRCMPTSTTSIRSRAGVPINKTIAGYGALKADPMPLSQIAANRKKASALVDKVGFDN